MVGIEAAGRGAGRWAAAARWHWAWSSIACVVLAVATFPEQSYPVRFPLDTSYVFEINRHAWDFRDVAFTYGPLGFLLCPVGDAHVALSFALGAGVQALLAILLILRARRELHATAALLIVALGITGLGLDFRVLLLVVLLAWRAVEERLAWMLVAAGILGGASLFVKLTIGVAALGAVVAASATWSVRNKRVGPAVAALGGAAMTFVAIGVVTTGDPVRWLGLSLAIAGGFSEAMSLEGPLHAVWAALGLIIGIAAFTVLSRDAGRLRLLAALAAPIFIAFKASFVRHDFGHPALIFPVLTTCIGLLMSAGSPRGLFGFAASAGALGSLLLTTGNPLATVLSVDFVKKGAQAAAASYRGDGARELQSSLVDYEIPGLPEIAAGRSVGVVPWNTAVCEANGLDCVSNPTLQTYSAYTATLDEITARHFASARAPELLLVHSGTVDGRLMGADAPLTWRAIGRHYERVAAVSPRALPEEFVLARRRAEAVVAEVPLASVAANAEQWVRVPDVPAPLLHVEMRLTAAGALAKLAYKVPPVYLEVRGERGERTSFRIVPDTARHGIPMPDVPGATDVAIVGPGSAYYQQPFPMRWTLEKG